MANLDGLNINPDVEESGGAFTVLPKGKYAAVIVGDELRDNKSGTGKVLMLELQIQEGEFKGEVLKDYLNITNPSEIAQKIGQGVLKKICNITSNQFPPQDTRKLWGIPMTISVDVSTFTSNTSSKQLQSNNVKAYDKYSATIAAQKTTDAAVKGSW